MRTSIRDGYIAVPLLARLRTIRMLPDTPGLHADCFAPRKVVAMAGPVKRLDERSGGSVRRPHSPSAITTRPVGKSLKVASGTLKFVASSRSGCAAIHSVIEIDW